MFLSYVCMSFAFFYSIAQDAQDQFDLSHGGTSMAVLEPWPKAQAITQTPAVRTD